MVWSGEGDEVVFAEALRDLVLLAQREGWTVGQVWGGLKGLRSKDQVAGNAFKRDSLQGVCENGLETL